MVGDVAGPVAALAVPLFHEFGHEFRRAFGSVAGDELTESFAGLCVVPPEAVACSIEACAVALVTLAPAGLGGPSHVHIPPSGDLAVQVAMRSELLYVNCWGTGRYRT